MKIAVPVSVLLATAIIVIFGLYVTTIIKSVPCGKGVLDIFMSNFIHTDPYHLIANLYSLYALSRVEQSIGSKKFVGLIVFLLIFNTVLESMIHMVIPSVPCGIGFSGVLFGVTTWELVARQNLDWWLLTSILGTVIVPSVRDSNSSLLGHAVGAFVGVLGGIAWKKIGFSIKKDVRADSDSMQLLGDTQKGVPEHIQDSI